MVRSVMSIQVPPKQRKQGKQMQRRLNIEQLKEEGIKTNFQSLLNENLPAELNNTGQYLKQLCFPPVKKQLDSSKENTSIGLTKTMKKFRAS